LMNNLNCVQVCRFERRTVCTHSKLNGYGCPEPGKITIIPWTT
jgi:hypothetical protein